MISAVCENGKVYVKGVKDFTPVHTFLCGQCFRWEECDDGSFDGVAFGKAVNISFVKDTLIISNSTYDDYVNIWMDYLDLNRDYAPFKKELSCDKYLDIAIKYGYGIRILNQEPWECLISFIISTQNQIPRIKKIVSNLCNLYGDEVKIDDRIYHTFPDVSKLTGITEADLEPLKAGYRAGYIIDAINKVSSGEVNLDRIFGMDYEDAKKELMKIKGVGEKVADCVLLFSFKKSEAFPVDVWVTKIMRKLYLDDSATAKRIREESKIRFGMNAGLAQQYLFYYARDNRL